MLLTKTILVRILSEPPLFGDFSLNQWRPPKGLCGDLRTLVESSTVRVHPLPLVLRSGAVDCFFSPECPPNKNPEQSTVGSRKGFVFFALVVVAAGGGVLVLEHASGGTGSLGRGKPAVKGSLHLETFVLNLADPDKGPICGWALTWGWAGNWGRARTRRRSVRCATRFLECWLNPGWTTCMTAAGKAKLKEDLLHALQDGFRGSKWRKCISLNF